MALSLAVMASLSESVALIFATFGHLLLFNGISSLFQRPDGKSSQDHEHTTAAAVKTFPSPAPDFHQFILAFLHQLLILIRKV